jgi:proteasome alpha subunit
MPGRLPGDAGRRSCTVNADKAAFKARSRCRAAAARDGATSTKEEGDVPAVAMQFYASPEQIMRDRSEYARRGISRGRSVVALTYEGGVLFVAENPSTALHKVSEIYDRIGFAAVGRYNEFENLRAAGVRHADLRGYSYDRRDVTGRALANAYAQTLGAIFTEQPKPFEVEICVAQVGASPEDDELYRLTYDGSVTDEPGIVAMGGQAEAILSVLRARHRGEMSLAEALTLAVEALASVGGEGGQRRNLPATQLEVAVLDRARAGRTFRRIVGAALTGLLGQEPVPAEAAPGTAKAEPAPGEVAGEPATAEPATGEPATAEAGKAVTGPGEQTAAGAEGPPTAVPPAKGNSVRRAPKDDRPSAGAGPDSTA